MNELNKRLIGGMKDFDKYASMALQMKGTCLESNVNSQLKETLNKYQLTCSLASDVLKKSEAIHDHHYEFEQNVKKTKNWIEDAWKIIRGNINSEGKTKEDLHGQLMHHKKKGKAIFMQQLTGLKKLVEILGQMEKTKLIPH